MVPAYLASLTKMKTMARLGYSWKANTIISMCLVGVICWSYLRFRPRGTTIRPHSHQTAKQAAAAIKPTFNPNVPARHIDMKPRIQQLKRLSKRARLFSEFRPSEQSFKYDCVPLHTLVGDTRICVYDNKEDKFVSALLRGNGAWEEGNLRALGNLLLQNRNTMLLDLGCNIGTFSMYAAKYGVKVVGVDPLARNLELLSESIRRQKLEDQVILLWNAVSNVHEDVKISQGQDHNIGSFHVRKSNDSRPISGPGYTIPTITLDDLVPLFEGQSVFVKMDIEGYEVKALQASEKFFKMAKVSGVMMEIVSHKMNDGVVWIDQYMRGMGYYPYRDATGTESLKGEEYKLWPIDVVYLKKRLPSIIS